MGSLCCRPEEISPYAERIHVIALDEEEVAKPTVEIGEEGKPTAEIRPRPVVESSVIKAPAEETPEQIKNEAEKEEETELDSLRLDSSRHDSLQLNEEFKASHTYRLPLYSAGGPRGFHDEASKEPDPFILPDIGHAIYLTFHQTDQGCLKIQFAEETVHINGRIIASGSLAAQVQRFKYKQATMVASDIWVSTGSKLFLNCHTISN